MKTITIACSGIVSFSSFLSDQLLIIKVEVTRLHRSLGRIPSNAAHPIFTRCHLIEQGCFLTQASTFRKREFDGKVDGSVIDDDESASTCSLNGNRRRRFARRGFCRCTLFSVAARATKTPVGEFIYESIWKFVRARVRPVFCCATRRAQDEPPPPSDLYSTRVTSTVR